jgi:hypothetical protein
VGKAFPSARTAATHQTRADHASQRVVLQWAKCIMETLQKDFSKYAFLTVFNSVQTLVSMQCLKLSQEAHHNLACLVLSQGPILPPH